MRRTAEQCDIRQKRQIVLPPRPYQKKGFSMEHITELGYKAVDTISGMDLYDDCGSYITSMKGLHISDFMDENENIDDDRLEAMIETEMEAVDFLNDQADYL